MNLRRALLATSVLMLCGCQTLSSWVPSWMPSIPTPSLSWLGFGHSRKPGPLPTFDAKAAPRVDWQVALGTKGGANFAPAARKDAIYAASPDGTLVSVDPATGKQNWRTKADKSLNAGVAVEQGTVIAGTDKGEVLAFDANGKPLWQVKISSEVAGPPAAAEGKFVVWSLDGKIFALNAADGAQKWVYQRSNPPLTVRRFAGGSASRGALFTGTPGGKLLAIDLNSGSLGWEASVATPARPSSRSGRYAPPRSRGAWRVSISCAERYCGRGIFPASPGFRSITAIFI